MRYLAWLLRIAVFLLLLGFAVRNTDQVTLHYYFGYEWNAPLVLVLLLFFTLGAVIGVLSCLGKIFKLRRESSSYKKKFLASDERG